MQYLIKSGKEAQLLDPARNWPDLSIAVFALDGDNIIGRLALVNYPHIDELEISENFRNGLVFSQLFKRAESVLKQVGKESAISFISDPQVEEYAKRLGYEKLDVSVWIKRIK